MVRFFNEMTKKPGSAPGEVSYAGEKKMEKTRIRLIWYNLEDFREEEFQSLDECFAYQPPVKGGVTWINIDGLHDSALIKKAGEHYGVHPLVLEDITNVTQRPKLEEYEHHLFMVLRMFYVEENQNDITDEQMSFVLGKDHLLSFQERVGDVFGEVRKRIRSGGSGFIRKHGADYLLYALADAIVDHYFVVLEKIGIVMEEADDELTENPSPNVLRKIHNLKKQIVFLRKMTWPLRELFASVTRTESNLIGKKTHIFFRDVQDHSIQVLDSVESFREMTSSMIDLYQSSMGNKMNEVMKVLTIIATIFIPPTFVAGIYGMNFDNMPELHTHSGYFIVIGVIMTSIVSMLVFFKKKHWI